MKLALAITCLVLCWLLNELATKLNESMDREELPEDSAVFYRMKSERKQAEIDWMIHTFNNPNP